jgi:aryl-alcohol dehydrogenase-like predicted oxidoreductase
LDYINFGKSGVKVSRIALGLGLRGQSDENVAQNLVEHAIDGGITFIDCANIYGPMDDRANIGRSEVVVGKALAGKRDRVVLTSKVCGSIGKDPNDRGTSAFHILREIENSLRRLNTDHLDVYLVHSYDKGTPQDETIRALDDIVRSGKARYVGCCNYDAWQVCRGLWVSDVAGSASYICVQNPYNLLNRSLEREMFGLIRDRGLGAMVYSPLAVGLLSGVYKPGDPPPADSIWGSGRMGDYAEATSGAIGETMTTLLDVADEIGKTPAQVAIAWILSHDEITCAISGSDNTDQIDDVIGSVGWQIPGELLDRLNQASSRIPLRPPERIPGAWGWARS